MDKQIDAKHSKNNEQGRNLAAIAAAGGPAMENASPRPFSPRWFAKMLPWANDAGTSQASQREIVVRHGIKIPIADGVATIGGEQLRCVPLFENCTDTFLEYLAARFQVERHAMGERVIARGDAADKFYILAEGEALVSDVVDHSDKVQLAMLAGGDHLGEIALLRGTGRTANVDTVTSCVFLTLARQDFLAALDAMPELRTRIEENIEFRVRSNQQAGLSSILRGL